MKKKMEISQDGVTIKVTVEVTAPKKELQRHEMSYLLNTVVEGIVPVIAKAPHIRGFLHEVKVK